MDSSKRDPMDRLATRQWKWKVVKQSYTEAGRPDAYNDASKEVAKFIRSKQSLLFKMSDQRAWPSLRTWALTTSALASAAVHELSGEERSMFLSAFVGDGAYGEFLSFEQYKDLPDPVDILNGKVEWEPDTRRVDKTATVLDSLTMQMESMENNGFVPKEAWGRYFDCLKKAKRACGADTIIKPLKLFVQEAKQDKNGRKLLAEMEEILQSFRQKGGVISSPGMSRLTASAPQCSPSIFELLLL